MKLIQELPTCFPQNLIGDALDFIAVVGVNRKVGAAIEINARDRSAIARQQHRRLFETAPQCVFQPSVGRERQRYETAIANIRLEEVKPLLRCANAALDGKAQRFCQG